MRLLSRKSGHLQTKKDTAIACERHPVINLVTEQILDFFLMIREETLVKFDQNDSS